MFGESFHPNTVDVFVEVAFNTYLEKTSSQRKEVGAFLDKLIRKYYLLPSQYERGLISVLKFASDLVVDIPKVWDYFGEMIGE